MHSTALESTLRLYAEPLQYAAFFALFVGLGLLELWFAQKPAQRGRRWQTNLALTGLCILTLGALPVSALMAADYAAGRGTGLLNDPAFPVSVAIVAGVLLRSLFSYLIHVAFHKSPWLWRLHAVHHTDTDVDVTTAVRMHPLEFVVSAALLLPCIVAFGLPAVSILIYEIFDAAMAVVTHGNVRLPRRLDRILRLALVTPNMHRIHHSSWQPETDSNYGATLSFWDRMFGTYKATARDGDTPQELGLSVVTAHQSHSMIWLLSAPASGAPQSGTSPM